MIFSFAYLSAVWLLFWGNPIELVIVDKYWPESSGLGNVVDSWLATLPMALPPKTFLHISLN